MYSFHLPDRAKAKRERERITLVLVELVAGFPGKLTSEYTVPA